MSIVIVAMSQTTACVASDSKMIGDRSSDKFVKIFKYSNELCMYGVGNAGITMGLFTHLNHMRHVERASLDYGRATQLLLEWKSFIESTHEYRGIFGVVGVCGFTHHRPESTTILIDSQDYIKHTKILTPSPKNVVDFYIMSPPDLKDDLCNQQFISSYQDTCGLPHQRHLIAAASNAIRRLAPLSSKINADVQYWSYDLTTRVCIDQILPLSPAEQKYSE